MFTAFKFTLTAGALISLARGYPLITSIVRDLEKYNHTKCLEEGEYLVDSNNGYYCFPLWAKGSLFPLFTPYGTYERLAVWMMSGGFFIGEGVQ